MAKNYSVLSTTTVSLIRKLSLLAIAAGCLDNAGLARAQTAEIVGNPQAIEDQVTVRIKVNDKDGKPAMELTEQDFKLIVDGKPLAFDPRDWKSSEESTPPPAGIIVLLDFSNSMTALDSGGTTKMQGAIDSIRAFTKTLADRGPNTKVAIVPFGKPGKNCEGFKVDTEALDRFFPASDFKLQNYLDFLAEQKPCASTNLYEPLTQAIRFLSKKEDTRFNVPKDSNQPVPRLSVILLSDGYHNANKEEEDFEALSSLLRRNQQIIVHTLGYGLTPKQLGEKYKLGRPATRKDVGANKKVPEKEFVDEKRLAEIADLTGGIHEFSGDSTAIAESLDLFLNALLGEYEITYTEPHAERGSKHDVSVEVDIPETNAATALKKGYAITAFGRSLPLPIRLIMLGAVLAVMGLGGALPFWMWANHLKQQELQEG
jgi:VWFA-related protein